MKRTQKIVMLAVMALSTVTTTTLTSAQPAHAQNIFGQVQKTMQTNIDRANNAGKHVRWCRKAHRSYRTYDDSYTNYQGLRVRCRSPHKF